jgi:IclR family pca regulon transcriptional regulator
MARLCVGYDLLSINVPKKSAMRTFVKKAGTKLDRRDFVASLETGLAVIEAFDAAHSRLTLTECAERTGLSRASARRYLLTLTQLRYANYDGKHFWLDLRVLRLGYGLLAGASLPRLAQPVLDIVAWQSQEMASLAVLDDGAAVFVARAQSRRLFAPTVGVGTRLPAWCSAAGRVLLSTLTDEELSLRLGHADLVAHTHNTVANPRDVFELIRAVRAQGYAINNEEIERGICAIAVPVVARNGRVEAAMTINTLSANVAADKMAERFLPVLLSGAQTLAQQL